MPNELMKQEQAPVMSLQREHDQFEFDYRLSKALSASNMTGIFKTPEQVFTAIQYGRGHGWSPMQSLRNLYPLHGNVHPTAIAVMGLVLPHADKPPTIKRENKDGQPYSCTVTYLRDGEEFSRTFTIDQAKSAGLVKGGGAWTAYAENMLYWRAGAFAAREAFPDILAGIYSFEEISNQTVEDYHMKDVTPAKEGTGLNEELQKLTGTEEKKEEPDGWAPLRYDDPKTTAPDPDTIVTSDEDVVKTEPEKKSSKKKSKSPSQKIKEMAASKTESVEDGLNREIKEEIQQASNDSAIQTDLF